MRYNKQELTALASSPSQNYDKEGIILLKETQDGFFRRTEAYVARWFRLKGNLLFYLHSHEQWSEPFGVIVLENQKVCTQNQDENGYWPFQIVFAGGGCYKLAMYTESERTSLLKFIQNASYERIKLNLRQSNLSCKYKTLQDFDIDVNSWNLQKKSFDLNEVALCELTISCDNLLCYPYGRSPCPVVLINVKNSKGMFVQYAKTEIVESCSNPSFLRTIMFRTSDGLTGDTLVQIKVYDVIEKISQVVIPVGYANVLLKTIQDTHRLRITLNSSNKKNVGFVTLNGWSLEHSGTSSSPRHTHGPTSMDIPQRILCHKRSHSLPPRLGVQLKLPLHGNIMKYCFENFSQASYRFHSGLGGDIAVHEVMAESKLCYQIPIQLLNLYIQWEMELLQQILCIGELNGKWKQRHIELLNTHLYLLQYYSNAIRSMKTHFYSNKGVYFKESSKKDDVSLAFVPVNLHLQRMWAYNDTLNKNGFHDVITVGAFTAHSLKAGETGGLLRLVQQMKDINAKVSLNSPAASRVQMASDAVQAIKQLRKEIFGIMDKLLTLAKMKQSTGMLELSDEMVKKTRVLFTLWDPGLEEEVLSFIEWNKVSTPTEDKPLGEMQQTNLPLKHLNQHLNLLKVCSKYFNSDMKLNFKNDSWLNMDLAEIFGNFESGPHINNDDVNHPSGLEFHNNHFVEHPEKNDLIQSELKQSQSSCANETNKLSNIIPNKLVTADKKLDKMEIALENNLVCAKNCQIVSNAVATKIDIGTANDTNKVINTKDLSLGNWCPSSEEPEPWDLTQLNIEASVMCLVSKVKFLCGRSGSPAVRLRHQKNTQGISTGQQSFLKPSEQNVSNGENNLKSSVTDTDNAVVATVNSVQKLVQKGNKFTEGLKLNEVNDWSEEVQPSMRKLKQALDGLLKTGRLAHSVLRLKCEHPHRTRALTALQMRRDTCFSQALTAITTGLICWLWNTNEEFIVTLLSNGLNPLCEFEGLLSLHGNEVAMWGDMVVAIEDLQTVQFVLTRTNHSTNIVPQVIGSRCSLTVLIPVPDSLYARFVSKEQLSFTITAVFFNMGINANATLAEESGNAIPQEQSNTDNFDRLNKYYHKFKKTFPSDPTAIRPSSRIKPLEDVMESLRIVVHKKTAKNYEILHLAALATRHMSGIRLTSCKSAKDRTGMSSTLEQCHILASDYHLAENELPTALNVMRSEGCRRENTFKNIQVKKYAFTKVQVASLPKEYRPPPGTYGAIQT